MAATVTPCSERGSNPHEAHASLDPKFGAPEAHPKRARPRVDATARAADASPNRARPNRARTFRREFHRPAVTTVVATPATYRRWQARRMAAGEKPLGCHDLLAIRWMVAQGRSVRYVARCWHVAYALVEWACTGLLAAEVAA